MNNYQINTGTIIELMNSNFKQFNREYLHNDFFYLVKYHLEEKQVASTVQFSEESRSYLEEYANVRFKKDLEFSLLDTHLPFPDYYIRKIKVNNENLPELVELNSNCIVEKEDENFDLFFAYQLALINIMEIDSFLDFHLAETFENNFTRFENFILKIIQKYKEILQDKRSPLIEHFLKNNETMQSTSDLPEKSNKDFTTARQVLAIHYLLTAINDKIYNVTDKTAIARFVQFMNGKETNNKTFKSTNIYKRVLTPFSADEKTLKEDLQYIRKYFENMNLQDIVNQINTEINNKV